MFKIIDLCGYVYDAYGTFVDANGDVQFILCNRGGEFYKTNETKGYYQLYTENSSITEKHSTDCSAELKKDCLMKCDKCICKECNKRFNCDGGSPLTGCDG